MKRYLITGCCGFIGSNLALRLLEEGNFVIGIDRLLSRYTDTINQLKQYKNFMLHDIDLSLDQLHLINTRILPQIDMVFHLAANADVRFSSEYPEKDLQDGIVATYNLLRWIKDLDIKNIAYASTSAIYGDATVIPTPETYFPIQTSFYGASKLSGEALIQAHCAAYGAKSWIFRFSSITGPKYSHGFIYNFYRKLKENPNELYVHGGQDQQKTYLDVEDCVDAMLTIVNSTNEKVNIFNLGNTETCTLVESIPIITNFMQVDPVITWSGNEVGWIGDSKINNLDISKLSSLGWTPKYTIQQTILRTLNWLENNQWILSSRSEI
jgi:UDP-glucose 4-epimerase